MAQITQLEAYERLLAELPPPEDQLLDVTIPRRINFTPYLQAIAAFMSTRASHPSQFGSMAEIMRWVATIPANADQMRLNAYFFGYMAYISSSVSIDISTFNEPERLHLQFYQWSVKGRKGDPGTTFESSSESMAFLPLDKHQRCDNCNGKGVMTVHCRECDISVDKRIVDAAWYCSVSCKQEDSGLHERLCLARKRFLRAIDLIFNMFKQFSAELFIHDVKSVVEDDGILDIELAGVKETGIMGKRHYVPFPYALIKPGDWSAVLFHGREAILARDCAALVKLLLNRKSCSPYVPHIEMLTDAAAVCDDLEIRYYTIKNAQRGISTTIDDYRTYAAVNTYTVLKATLETGESFAVDFTGAQFGWQEIVAPWDRWVEQRVMGTVLPNMVPKEFIVIPGRAESMSNLMTAVLRDLHSKQLLPVATGLYSLDNDEYTEAKDGILEQFHTKLLETAESLRSSRFRRWYLNHECKLTAPRDDAQAEILERIWLTEQEYKDHDDDWTRQTWFTRCTTQLNKPGFASLGLLRARGATMTRGA